MAEVWPTDIVVTSTGLISREVFSVKDRELNFYMMGSMGCALAIGIGIAMHSKNKVVVINGDGSALMGLGAIVTSAKLRLENLQHIILDNNMHESTGGQRTNSDMLSFYDLGTYLTDVYKIDGGCPIPPRITLSPEQITKRFKDALLRQQKKQEIS